MKKIYKNNRMQKKNKLNNIVAILLILGVFGIFTQFVDGKEEISTANYQVQDSDTLWNIAGKICNDSSNKDLNRQNLIIEIKSLNNLSESNIFAGQVIQLPVY